jgi:hypothetical protein
MKTKILICGLLITFILTFIRCQEEHPNEHNVLLDGMKSKILDGKNAKLAENKIKNLINENISNGKLNREIISFQADVDYSSSVLIETQDGVKSYAFNINNNDYTKDELYNLVLIEKGIYSTVTVVKYNLTNQFATDYYAGLKNFSQFEGSITNNVILTNDPCPPVETGPIGTGNSNGTGGNGGTGANTGSTGSTNSGGTSGGSGGGVTLICNNCNRSYESVGAWQNSICGSYSVTIFISVKRDGQPQDSNNPTGNTNNNPCDKGAIIPVFLSPQNALTLRNFYKNNLTAAQKEYIANNVILRDKINDFLINNSENGIVNQKAKDLVINLINGIFQNNITLPQYTENNYPGQNQGRPFGWWNNKNYVIQNLSVANIVPNVLELFLFQVFPAQALLHIENSTVALNTAQQLASNNSFSDGLNGLSDGRADAFRHCFWNALGTAEFGGFVTELFTDAHEAFSSGLSKDMDLFNNDKGITLSQSNNFSLLTNDSTIQTAVLALLYNSQLVYIFNNALTPTN